MTDETGPQKQKTIVSFKEFTAEELARDLFERREKGRRDIDSQLRWSWAKGFE